MTKQLENLIKKKVNERVGDIAWLLFQKIMKEHSRVKNFSDCDCLCCALRRRKQALARRLNATKFKHEFIAINKQLEAMHLERGR